MVRELTPQEFLALRAGGRDMVLLDVREDWEVTLAPVPDRLVHIPMGQIESRLGELEATRETVVICRSGARSMQVARFLESRGFAAVANLAGGILAWSRNVDPTIPQY